MNAVVIMPVHLHCKQRPMYINQRPVHCQKSLLDNQTRMPAIYAETKLYEVEMIGYEVETIYSRDRLDSFNPSPIGAD